MPILGFLYGRKQKETIHPMTGVESMRMHSLEKEHVVFSFSAHHATINHRILGRGARTGFSRDVFK